MERSARRHRIKRVIYESISQCTSPCTSSAWSNATDACLGHRPFSFKRVDRPTSDTDEQFISRSSRYLPTRGAYGTFESRRSTGNDRRSLCSSRGTRPSARRRFTRPSRTHAPREICSGRDPLASTHLRMHRYADTRSISSDISFPPLSTAATVKIKIRVSLGNRSRAWRPLEAEDARILLGKTREQNFS